MSQNCHHCPFTTLFSNIGTNPTYFIPLGVTDSEYKKMNMEYPLYFRLNNGSTYSEVEKLRFREYGVYTLVIRSLTEPVPSLCVIYCRCK